MSVSISSGHGALASLAALAVTWAMGQRLIARLVENAGLTIEMVD
ncbi:MAG: hypothetical protein SGJ03_02300 [Alphaproteobacteria bacterium]|nr:hypothetical protein [Alphaproteobacteria bacterium]